MILRPTGKKGEQMKFRDLSRYEGTEVEFKRGLSQLTELDGTRVPDKCVFLKDYEKTVLLDFIYIYNEYGFKVAPRHFKKMVNKASMYVGDVVVLADTYLVGGEVYR